MRLYSRQFVAACRALHGGRLSFSAFCQATAETWQRLAEGLYARWTPPAGCTVEDVRQELLLGVWQAVPKWNPCRATAANLPRFIVWNACARAKYWLHQQRGSNLHGRRDGAPSRYPLAFSAVGLTPLAQPAKLDATAKRFAVALVPQHQPEAEQVLQRKNALVQVLPHCRTLREEYAMAALAAVGSVDQAADRVYDDLHARRVMRLGSRQQARTVVRRALAIVARRAGAA